MDDSPSFDQLEDPSSNRRLLTGSCSSLIDHTVEAAPSLCIEDDYTSCWNQVTDDTKKVPRNSSATGFCSSVIKTTPKPIKKLSIFNTSMERQSPPQLDKTLINYLKNKNISIRPEKGIQYTMPEQKYSNENLKNIAGSPPGLKMVNSPFGSPTPKYGSYMTSIEQQQIGPLSTLLRETLETSNKNPEEKVDSKYASSLPSLKKPIFFTSSTENLQNLSANLNFTENLQLSATSSAYVINSSRKGSLVSILQDEGLVPQNGKIRNFGKASKELGPEELNQMKKDILTPKNLQTSSTESELNNEDFGRKKRDKLPSQYYGMMLYQPQASASLSKANGITEEPDIFDWESEISGTQLEISGSQDDVDETGPLGKLTSYLLNQPLAQNWFFKKSAGSCQESSNSTESLNTDVVQDQAHSYPKSVEQGDQVFLTRPSTFPQLAELNVWDQTKN